MSTLAKEIDEWLLMTEASSDDRPEVVYRPLAPIEVGYRASVVVLDVDFGGSGATGVVIAFDKTTGAFETKRTRYVLDTSYEH